MVQVWCDGDVKQKKENKKQMNGGIKERQIWSKMDESPQDSPNERIRDFIRENFFKRFPQGSAAFWLKLLKAWWKNILTAQS